jgi:hypothetical protein
MKSMHRLTPGPPISGLIVLVTLHAPVLNENISGI